MAVYLDKKTNRFYIQFQYQGTTYKERLHPGITKKNAEIIELKMRSDLLFQQHGIKSNRDISFERFVREYFVPHIDAHYSEENIERAIHIVKAAKPFLKGKMMRDIKPADLDRFQSYRAALPTMHKKPRQPATVAREMSIISKIFSLAVKNDICDYNPYTRVDKPSFDNVQDKVLSLEHEERFFAAFRSDWCRDICMVALYTGLRQKDILSLTRFNVDLKDGVIRLTQSKTDRRIEVIIVDKIRPMIERRYKRRSDSPLMFPSPRTGIQGTQTKTAIKNACIRAKIPVITIRDLRRTCASRLEDLGFNSGTIAKFLGHSDLRSVHRYQRSRNALQEAAKALENQSQSTKSLPIRKLRRIK